MKKVLVVEDLEDLYSRVEKRLHEKVSILWADSLEKAWSIFEGNPDIDLIVMDACVHGNKPDSMPLVARIKESGYGGPIIAWSSSSSGRQALLKAGATHEVDKGMGIQEIVDLVLVLLEL